MSTLEHAGELSPPDSVQVATGDTARTLHVPRFGRPFFNPAVDLLLVCGGLSIPLLMFEGLDPSTVSISGSSKIAIFLLFNFAHFASSTVRLRIPDDREHRFQSNVNTDSGHVEQRFQDGEHGFRGT